MSLNETLSLLRWIEDDHAVYAGSEASVERWKQLRAIVLGAAAAEERGRRRRVEEVKLGTCRVYRHGCSDGRAMMERGPDWRQYALPHPRRDNCVEWVALAPRDSTPEHDPYVEAGVDDWGAPRDSGKDP